MCGSEFGRTPVFEFQDGGEGRLRNGRDHNPHGFTMWFAGAGVRGRLLATARRTITATTPCRTKSRIHDLHATILHAMGLNHEKLTYRFGGRDYRLTDVSGEVIKSIFV